MPQDSQIVLPTGFEDAKPTQAAQVTLPPGFEDAKPVGNSSKSIDARTAMTHPELGQLPGVAKPSIEMHEQPLAVTLLGGEGHLSDDQRRTFTKKPLNTQLDPVEDFKQGSKIMTDFGSKFGRKVGANVIPVADMLASDIPGGSGHVLTEEESRKRFPISTGVLEGAGGMAGGMALDPTNWALAATGAEAGPILSKLASAAFAAKMGKDTIEGAKQLGAEWDNLNPEQRAERITQLGLQDVFTGLAGAHSATGEHGAIDLTKRGARVANESIVKPAIRNTSGFMADNAKVVLPSVGAGIGIAAASEMGIPHAYAIGGGAGAGIGRAVAKPIGEFLDRGRTFGMAPEEASVTRLKVRAQASAKELAKAQAEVDRYKASTEQGVEAPEDVRNAYDKAKAKADEDQFHLEAARERLDASRRPKPTATPDQPITAESLTTPEAPKSPLGKAINVKGPGEIQPEVIEQPLRDRPSVNEGATLSLAGDEGVRVGKPKALPAVGEQKQLPERASAIELGEGDPNSQPHSGLGRAFTEGRIEGKPMQGEVLPALRESMEPGPTGFPEAKIEKVEKPLLKRINTAVHEALGVEPLRKNVPLKEQLGKPAEIPAEEPLSSSDPRKAELLKSKASPEQMQKIMALKNTELRQLAMNLGEDMGTLSIGRGKGTFQAGTHVPVEEVYRRLLKDHSVADIAQAIDRGKHLPAPEGTPVPPAAPNPKSALGSAIAKPTESAEGTSTKGLGKINTSAEAEEPRGDNDQYKQAVQLVRDHNRGSAVLIQRTLKIPFARAVEFLDRMEEDGVVGPAKGAGPRDVLGTEQGNPNYEQLFKEAESAGPHWTPEKAKTVLNALGDNFELRGSVAEGRSTSNDLDIWQKSGKLSEAAPALKKQGFTFSHKTPHGEVWVKGDQAVDLWDAEHPPKKGLGGIAH